MDTVARFSMLRYPLLTLLIGLLFATSVLVSAVT
jgi:hypothetical protein